MWDLDDFGLQAVQGLGIRRGEDSGRSLVLGPT